MLYIVGLGLAEETDITVKGLNAVRGSARVYLEAYTSILLVETKRLEEFYGRQVIVADRDMVESEADKILEGAETLDVAFLVVGDPFGATTHTDLMVRALERNIPVKVIHNASVMNAVGAAGLQLYNYGATVSICFFTDTWRPDSFYEKIKVNRQHGMHTLCLLDIKVKEQSMENLLRGRKIYEPPRYMTIRECIQQLLEVEENKKEGVYGPNSIGVGIARLGSVDQCIISGTFTELLEADFGAPLHCFVIPGEAHFLEKDLCRRFAHNSITFDQFIDEGLKYKEKHEKRIDMSENKNDD